MTLRMSLCATAFVAAPMFLGLAACSRVLEVQVFNASDDSMRVCSVAEGLQCLDLAGAAASVVLGWGQGVFTVESDGCKRTYEAPLALFVDTINDYRASYSSPVNVVIARDHRLLLVRNGQRPGDTSEASQPRGFPVVPVAEGTNCK